MRNPVEIDMTGTGADTIFSAPVLIVRQKTKLIEVSNEYTIHRQHGDTIAEVRQVGQGRTQKALRFLGTPADRLLTFKLEVSDRGGNVLLRLTRPAKVVKSHLVVHDGEGNELGQIVQGAFGERSFSLQADGEQLGTVVGKDWTSSEFVVQDRLGSEVAHLTHSLEGLCLLDLALDGRIRHVQLGRQLRGRDAAADRPAVAGPRRRDRSRDRCRPPPGVTGRGLSSRR